MSRLLGPAPRTSRQFGSRLPSIVAFREPWPSVIAVVLDAERCRLAAASAQLMCLAESAWGPPQVQLANVEEARHLSPASIRECRAPSPHVGMPNYTGCIPVPNRQRSRFALTESFNERHHYMDLILTRPVAAFCAQPFRICWQFDRGVRVHTPDALLEMEDGRRLLVDVTRSAKLEDAQAMAVFALTAMTAASLGWDYELRTELPEQRTVNVRHLWCYRTDERPEAIERWRAAVSRMAWPLLVSEARVQLDAGSAGLAAVWHLLAERMIHADLGQPLTPSTQLLATPLKKEEPWVAPL